MKSANTLGLSYELVNKHLAVQGNLDLYPGIVTQYGMARLAVNTGREDLVSRSRNLLAPYVRGERQFFANFPNYLCGGAASAYMLYKGHLPEAEADVRKYAEQIINEAPRDPEGILCHPRHPGENRIWIDTAFAVGPFLLFAGLALGDDRYVRECFEQTAKMYRIFLNPENGLLHQSRGFRGAEFITDDHWCRGNGWGTFALVELAHYLPQGHPYREEAVRMYREHILACLKFQDAEGLWRQEMTEMSRAYAETSGTSLLLYALGVGLETGLLDASYRAPLLKGLSGLLNYISTDFDVFHTCCGCLCPGNGTRLDYMAQRPVRNDNHAFGPIILAMGQAHHLGIDQLWASC